MDAFLPYLTPFGLVALGVISIWRGWWVPASSVKLIISTLTARITDRDAEIIRLRETIAIQNEAQDLVFEQVRLMVEANRTSNAALMSLPAGPGKDAR